MADENEITKEQYETLFDEAIKRDPTSGLISLTFGLVYALEAKGIITSAELEKYIAKGREQIKKKWRKELEDSDTKDVVDFIMSLNNEKNK